MRVPGPLLFVLAGVLSTSAQQTPTFKIIGQVVRRPDNGPVRGAHVTVTMVDHADRHLSVVTGENGEFSFGNLPAAKYTLEATYRGWSQFFQQNEGFSTAIAVGAGLDTEHVVFPLDSAASISGTVVDEDGEPVAQAQVYLFWQTMFRGVPQTRMNTLTNTKSAGTFRFGHLRAGTYYVAVTGRPWYAQNGQPFAGDAQAGASDLDVAFPLTYYAGARTPEGATPLKLEEGANTQIQINLHAVPALHISLEGAETPEPVNGSLNFMPNTLSQLGPGGSMLGTYPLNGVAPGSYVLNSATGSQTINLTADTTVNIKQATKTSVSGKLLCDGEPPANMSVWMENVTSGDSFYGQIGRDGVFDMGQIRPGRFRVLLANDPDMYMQKVAVKDGTYQQGEIEVGPGARMELTITAVHGLTKISGIVRKDKKPVAGAMVLLIASDFSHGHWIPRDQSDSDGTFTLAAVIPGRYTLIAIDDGRNLAYDDPAVRAPYLAGGLAVDAPLGKDASVEVEVQPRR